MLDESVAPETSVSYHRTAAIYRREYGGIRHNHMMEAILVVRRKGPGEGERRRASRATIGSWTRRVRERLVSYTNHHKRRGAIDDEMMETLLKAAEETGDETMTEGLKILRGCTVRPHDIKDMTAWEVDLKHQQVMPNAKRTSRRLGEYEAHAIVHQEEYDIVAHRVEQAHNVVAGSNDRRDLDDVLLFPNWTSGRYPPW